MQWRSGTPQSVCTQGTEMCDGRAQISTFRPFTSSAIEGRRKRVPGFVAAGDGTLVYYFPFGRKSRNAPTFSERQKIQTVTVWKSYGLRIVECRRDYTRWVSTSGHNSQRARLVRLRETVRRKRLVAMPVRVSRGGRVAHESCWSLLWEVMDHPSCTSDFARRTWAAETTRGRPLLPQ